MAVGLDAVYGYRALLLAQQSADEVEQGRLAHAVLAEQSVDVVLAERQAEVVEHILFCACIFVFKVAYFYHIVSFYFMGCLLLMGEMGVMRAMCAVWAAADAAARSSYSCSASR